MENKILKVKWSKREEDLIIKYPRRCDGAIVTGKQIGRASCRERVTTPV